MKITGKGDQKPERRRRRGRQRSELFLLAALVVLGGYAYSFDQYVRDYHRQPGEQPHLTSPEGRQALWDIARAAPARPLRWLWGPPIERLQLEIKFRNFQKIAAKREEALRREFLITSSEDFVPARLRHEGREVRVRVRLKGDLVDHLLGDKWSYRVVVRGGQSVLGMRRFSLQAPYTRDFQAEPLFFDFLREWGVLAPRYFFVDLGVNGRQVGRMALEEHFSSELLGHQRRREGPIVRFDEQYFYRAELAFMDLVPDYDNWRNVPVEAFRRGQLERVPARKEQMEVAFGLLRGVAEDRLSPSQAFDPGLWGRFLAACEIWSTPHMTHWNNLRFYLDPIALRLEPVAFDASGESHASEGFRCMGGVHAMMTALIQDPALRAAFLESVRELSDWVASPDFEAWLRGREASYLPLLRGEFPWLHPYPLQELRERVRTLRAVSEENFDRYLPLAPERPMPHRPDADYPTVVHAYLQRDASGPFLELASAISRPVTVTELWIEPDGDQAAAPGASRKEISVYHPLSATPWPQKPERIRVDMAELLPDEGRWSVGGRALVGGEPHVFRAIETAPVLERPPLPRTGLEEVLARHAFLRRDAEAGWLVADSGSFDVEGALALPEGVGLRIAAGTRLRFGSEGVLLARGPLEFLGEAASPIVLEARDGSWWGVVALGDRTPIHWSHVVVRDTGAPALRGWGVTGGVTFQGADLQLEDCRFQGSRAEDALNLVRSQVTLRRVEVRGAASDALDVDFCEGRIEGGRIADARGDGIELSGSRLEVEDVSLRGIGDEALSVGEGSEAVIRRVQAAGCGVGVASRDRSVVRVESSSLSGVERAALMAYAKKPEYGPAELEAVNVRIEGAAREAIAQLGSRISRDGNTVEPEPLDADAFE